MVRQQGTTLFIPGGMYERLSKVAEKKGFLNWSELARTLLDRALTEEERSFMERIR